MRDALQEGFRTVVGIDPGAAGWAVGLSLSTDHAFAVPLKFSGLGDLLFENVANRVRGHLPLVYLEEVQGRGGWAAQANFTFGYNYGQLRHALQQLGWPVVFVKPQEWQKVMHAGAPKLKQAKMRSLCAYEAMFDHDPLPRLKGGGIKDGAIDAWLLAAYGASSALTLPMRKWRLT